MERVSEWLKTHSSGEKSFARALQKFFSDQADRIADAIAEGVPHELAFRPQDEHQLFMPIIKRNLGNLMVIGARAELQAAERAAKAFDPSEDIVWHDLPAETRQRIIAALDESAEQPYWLAIQSETEHNLIEIIERGFADGLSSYQIGMKIREGLGGYEARKRAYKIARTETTGAMNAGHVAQMQSLGAAVEGKKWLSITDKDARESHAAANGQTVRGVDTPFVIGGYEAPYPGHFSLPAAERVNCRCVVLSVLNEGILAASFGTSP
jgi:uncharacterized protein with gpF-like domain